MLDERLEIARIGLEELRRPEPQRLLERAVEPRPRGQRHAVRPHWGAVEEEAAHVSLEDVREVDRADRLVLVESAVEAAAGIDVRRHAGGALPGEARPSARDRHRMLAGPAPGEAAAVIAPVERDDPPQLGVGPIGARSREGADLRQVGRLVAGEGRLGQQQRLVGDRRADPARARVAALGFGERGQEAQRADHRPRADDVREDDAALLAFGGRVRAHRRHLRRAAGRADPVEGALNEGVVASELRALGNAVAGPDPASGHHLGAGGVFRDADCAVAVELKHRRLVALPGGVDHLKRNRVDRESLGRDDRPAGQLLDDELVEEEALLAPERVLSTTDLLELVGVVLVDGLAPLLERVDRVLHQLPAPPGRVGEGADTLLDQLEEPGLAEPDPGELPRQPLAQAGGGREALSRLDAAAPCVEVGIEGRPRCRG